MRFSIITATLQSGATLPRALQSLRTQSCHDLEHIIVDGGSTDETLRIARKYASESPWPVKIITQQGKGVYDALNEGVKAAEGELVGVLHSDDRYYSEDLLATVAQEYAKSGTHIIYGDVLYTSGRRYSAGKFRAESLLCGFAPPHPGIFIHRGMFERYGMYDPSYLSGGDFELLVRMVLKGGEPTLYLPRVMQIMDSTGRSSSWRYRLLVNLQEKRRALLNNGYRAPWHRLLRRYLY